MLHWVEQGVTNIEDLRKRTVTYFSGVMDQASATFKSNARSFVIVLSIFLTLLLGTDSIQMAKTLWENAGLRAVAVAKAELVVQQEGSTEDIDSLITDLGDLKVINADWIFKERPATPTALGWLEFLGLKFIGLGLTVAAVSQGSSFWYDLLKKLVSKGGSSGGGDEAKG